ncbi:hypothetical protein ABPG74_014058 [Tetrahymena malaccensis]
MKTTNLRKKSTYNLEKQKYISNRKRQDYEKDLEESDPDEYENDLNDLKQRLHKINYNYYTEALRLALIEKSRPLMPLKLGPLVSKQTFQAGDLRGVNGQSAITGQFNQGNIQQYNDLTSQTYKQMLQNQQNNQYQRQSQSSPLLIYNQNNPYGQYQSQRNSFQSYNAQNIDTIKLPQINQSAVYQKSKFQEQLPIISSPTGSNYGQNTLTFDQQQYINNLQNSQMNNPQYDTTKLQQQRLTQLGTPYENQEYYQVIDGKKYKIRQSSVNSPQIQVFGADQYTQQRKKKKSVFHSKPNDQEYSRKSKDYDEEQEEQFYQPASKSRKSIYARSKKNIEMKSQKKIDNYDDGYDDQEDYEDNYKRSRQSKSKLKSKQQINYNQDDNEENEYDSRSRRRNKSRKFSRAQDEREDDYDDNRSVRSNKRSKSRKNTYQSRRGGDYQEENGDDDIQTGKKKNKSKYFKNEDIDDFDGLDEFKPRQNQANDNLSEYDNNTKNQRKKTFIQRKNDYNEENEDEQVQVRPARGQRQKTMVKSRNQNDDFDQDERTQNQTQKRKKTMIINDDNQESKYKSRRDITEKKKTVLMSKNQIKSLKHLNDIAADDL